MITPKRKEKCRQNRLAKRHFRPLGARETRTLLLPVPLERRGPMPAKTLPRKFLRPIWRVGI
jgi:hypothetical protein